MMTRQHGGDCSLACVMLVCKKFACFHKLQQVVLFNLGASVCACVCLCLFAGVSIKALQQNLVVQVLL